MRKPPAWLPQASDPGLAVAGGRRQCARGQDGAASLMEARATVYFDGGCPVCAREIGFYKRRPAAKALNWVDVTQADEAALGPACRAGRRPHASMYGGRMASSSLVRPPSRRSGARCLAYGGLVCCLASHPSLPWPNMAMEYFCTRESYGDDMSCLASLWRAGAWL